jgi:hypothetical protein
VAWFGDSRGSFYRVRGGHCRGGRREEGAPSMAAGSGCFQDGRFRSYDDIGEGMRCGRCFGSTCSRGGGRCGGGSGSKLRRRRWLGLRPEEGEEGAGLGWAERLSGSGTLGRPISEKKRRK